MPRRGKDGGTPFGDARAARLLAHELNNIALPLRGFVDLAEDASLDQDALLQCFRETRAGSHRLADLARDLAALGEDEARIHVIALGDCLPPLPTGSTFSGDPAIRVRADPDHLRHSLEMLLSAAGSDASITALRSRAGRARHCAGCGIRTPGSRYLELRLHTSRVPLLRALRDPLRSSLRLSPTQRVRIAASAHLLHLAGAHIFQGGGAVIVALPLAARGKT